MMKVLLENLNSEAIAADKAEAVEQAFQELIKAGDGGFDRVLDEGNVEYPHPRTMEKICQRHRNLSNNVPTQNFVVLGTGGSSLGAEALITALYDGDINFYFLDNNDENWFRSTLQKMNPQETLFYVVSKSGNTTETLTQYFVARAWIEQAGLHWQDHFIFCTGPEKGDLRQHLASEPKASVLEHPVTVGGRFAVLTPVGMVPAAFAGLSVESFLEGARQARYIGLAAAEKPSLQLAHSLCALAKEKPISVLMPYATRLRAFGRWFNQLWAESLGKAGKGFTPYAACGTTDQHSQMQLYMEGPRDKTIGFIEVAEKSSTLVQAPSGCEDLANFQLLSGHSMANIFQAELDATREALTQSGVANYSIKLESLNEKSLGCLFYFWEATTVYASCFLDIYPFTQPGVELGKKLTKQKLQLKG